MKNKLTNQRFLRQRKLLLVLPLLVIPFLAIIFAALGGGKTAQPGVDSSNSSNGLNTALPDAQFGKGQEKDKLGIYEQMNRDTARLRDELKKDPNLLRPPGMAFSPFDAGIDSNESRVVQKLGQLKMELSKPPETRRSNVIPHYETVNASTERLEQLVQAIKTQPASADPELTELNNMLDKLQQLQHPVAPTDTGMNKPIRQVALTVEPVVNDDGIGLLGTVAPVTSAKFFGLESEAANSSVNGNAFEAMIEERQTVVSGATVKVKLLNDLIVKQSLIPSGHLLYGTATLNDERLRISITSIRSGNNILPVSLEVYDEDGLPGIYVPGSITRDISKQSADQSIGSIGMTSLNPSLGAQVAGEGIQTAKTYMSKKIKLVRLTIPSGYRVWLKDNSR